jgi:hypothetical protein
MQDHKFELSVNTGFLVNRYTNPDEWVSLVSNHIGIKNIQFTADLINPSLPSELIDKKIKETNDEMNAHDVKVSSSFTGAFTRLNNLTHPDEDFRKYYENWFKIFADITVGLGSKYMGSHFAILTQNDLDNDDRKTYLREQAIKSWHKIGAYALDIGIEEIYWEPMSISREFGETIDEAIMLNDELNNNSPIPFSMCLDVDHGDLESTNPQDIDPYIWIEKCNSGFNMLHLKQSSSNKGGHWPFTEENNKDGKVVPEKVIESIKKSHPRDVQMVLELSFKERQPSDRLAAEHVKESVAYWKKYI